MKKTLLIALAALTFCGAAIPARAQSAPLQVEQYPLQGLRDLAETAYTYCATYGINETSTGRNKLGRVTLTIGAGSTTVAGTNAFANIAANDVLFLKSKGVIYARTITARASADSITINASIDAAAVTVQSWEYRTSRCGTADTSGAIPITGALKTLWQIEIVVFNATSIDYQIQCRVSGPASAWTIAVGPTNKVAVFAGSEEITKAYDECRLGLKVNTDTGVNSITAQVAVQR